MTVAEKEERDSKSEKVKQPSAKMRLSHKVWIFSLVGILCLAQFVRFEVFLNTTKGTSTTTNHRQNKKHQGVEAVSDLLSFFQKHSKWEQRQETTSNNTVGDVLRMIDSRQCISRTCMAQRGMLLARIFPDYSQNTKWHDTRVQKSKQRIVSIDSKNGILLIKMPEAASSNAAAVAIRIARQYNANVLTLPQTCAKRACYKRKLDKSYLLTSIRSPESRSISRAFSYYISALHLGSTDDDIKKHLETNNVQHGSISKGQGGFQLQYASMDRIEPYSFWNESQPEVVVNLPELINLVQRVIDNYDFILVAERLDESFVALSFRLGVSLQDVMYTTSQTVSYYLLGEKCIKLQNTSISPAIQQLLDSNRWNAMNYGDYLLHSAANKSLDLTIDAIGKERFQLALKDFQQL